MNKRQVKKAFKKKYGVNPNRVAKDLDDIIRDIAAIDWQEVGRALGEGIEQFVKEFNEAMVELARDINEASENLKKEIEQLNKNS